MIKTFNKDSIIKVDNYFVVVDKSISYRNYDYITDGKYCWEYILHNSTETNPNPNYKVISTIGKRLGNIPLIELSNEIDNKLYEQGMRLATANNEYCSYDNHSIDCECCGFAEGYEKGYRTAQFQGLYTEEDIHEAIGIGMRSNKSLNRNIKYFHEWRKRKQDFEILKIPVIESIELEYEEYNARPDLGDFLDNGKDNYGGDFLIMSRLKITNKETNTITPVRVVYNS